MVRRDPTPDLTFFEGGGAPLRTARLRRVALRITRNPAAADDVVQSALEKALRHRAEFRGEAQPSTWLHRIAVNEALAWRRSEGRRAKLALAAHAELPTAAGGQPLDELLLRGGATRAAGADVPRPTSATCSRASLDGGYGCPVRRA
jgi:hypothetical protein